MKIAIITNKYSYETDKIVDEFSFYNNITIERLNVSSLFIKIINGEIGIFKDDTCIESRDILSFDVYLVRVGGENAKYIVEALKLLGNRIVISDVSLLNSGTKFSDYMLCCSSNKNINLLDTTFLGMGSNVSLQRLENAGIEFPNILKGSPSSRAKEVYKLNDLEEIFMYLKQDIRKNKVFQVEEYVPGGVDYRLLVINNRFIGAIKNESKDSDDFHTRRSSSIVNQYFPDDNMINMAINIASSLNVFFAGIDMIMKDGKPYMLECNTIPMFKRFERVTNVNVAKIFVSSLIEKYGIQ